MCYGLTKDKVAIDDAVQELYVYFLSMNPETLKTIWEKDGTEGIVRYGAVVLRRALTSTRSPFYYQYKKYYTHIDEYTSTVTYNIIETGEVVPIKHLYNLPEEEVDDYQWTKLEEIDKILDTLYWYDKKIFQLYYSGETLDSLAQKTGISRNSLFTTIDKVRTLLKKELLDE
jgi:DNA-directed RNA polymerase specialized sigma24 family protein